MKYLVAIILGLIQGVTEFIPVSSSGHLIIARAFIGSGGSALSSGDGGLAFDAILQLATSLALIVYFRREIWSLIRDFLAMVFGKPIEPKQKTLIFSVIIGTIPAVIFGLLLESTMDTVFRNVNLVALTLILGSFLFMVAERFGKQDKELSIGKGVAVGFFQCLALVPGVSRSGATISGGLFMGFNREQATRFSFLLSIPILFGAGLKKLFEVRHALFTTGFGFPLLLGSAVAFVSGLAAISLLIRYLKNHNLNIFIWYRIILAIIIFFVV
jgi:undecaprenyl-diphosphatase